MTTHLNDDKHERFSGFYSTLPDEAGANWRGGSATLICLPMAMLLSFVPGSAMSDRGHEEIPFDVAELYFELNHTDGDLGIHSRIDGEPWKRLRIEDPRERRMLDVKVLGRLRRQGLTELFFESAEPTFDELAPADFFYRFPEGTYEIEGRTHDGLELASETELTHVLPAPADNVRVAGMRVPEDCDEGPVPVVPVPNGGGPIVISWDPVTESHPDIGRAGEVEIVKYELYLEREEPEPILFFMDLPPHVTTMGVPFPENVIGPGEQFKLEVLVREASGNQTAVESCFYTAGE